MSKAISVSNAKAQLPALVAGVEEREDEVVVTRNGRPAAVLVNYDEYQRLRATLEVLSDPALMEQINSSRKFYARRRRGVDFEELFGDPARHPRTKPSR